MVTRITGLASGMDIDSMVKQLMTAAKVPLDKLKQQKQILEWQRDDYRDMNSALLDFRSLLTQMKLTTNYRARQVASSDDSKVTATASSAAGLTSYSISNVTQLASAETIAAKNSITNDAANFDPTKSLQTQSFVTNPNWKTGVVETQTFNVTSDNQTISLTNIDLSTVDQWSVKVNGKTYKIVASDPAPGTNEVQVAADGTLKFGTPLVTGDTVKVDYIAPNRTESFTSDGNTTTYQLSRTLVGNVSITTTDTNNNVTTYTVNSDGSILDSTNAVIGNINYTTGKITFNNPLAKDTKLDVTFTQQYSSFSIDSWTSKGEVKQNFLVQGSDSLNTVISKVNSSGVGVNMFYDSFSGKMSVVRTETGDFNSAGLDLQITGDFAKAISLETNENDSGGNSYVNVQEGKNAKFTLNGLETERTSNTFTVSGVNFTLKQTFDSPVTVSVTNDSDTVYQNIKNFIDKYNDLIDKISKKTSEERYRDYPPLTDDQREQLTDKQQEQWEEKAKSGLLRNDPILTGLLSKMRTNFYSTVQNDSVSANYNQIAKIGITTSSNFLDGGKLIIDDAKLKQAIQDDPTSVENLFRGDGGIIQQLYDTVNNAMSQLKDKAGNSYSTNQQFSIGRQLDDIDKRVTDMQNSLDDLENRYYNQFTAMEQAIQQANQQSLYLTQMLSGGN